MKFLSNRSVRNTIIVFFLAIMWALFFYLDHKLNLNYYSSMDDDFSFIFPILFPAILIGFFNGTNRLEKIINFLITSIFGIMLGSMMLLYLFLYFIDQGIIRLNW